MITPDNKPLLLEDKDTIELECKHRFCSECVIQQLQVQIEKAEIDKLNCLDFECGAPISDEKLEEILLLHNHQDLYDKKKRFAE